MKEWTDQETIHRKVSIAGRVLDGNGMPVAGAQIKITSMPDEFGLRIAVFESAAKARRGLPETGPDSTLAHPDGLYYFLDLPDGKYTLTAMDPRSGKHDEKKTSVLKDKKMSQVDFTISLKRGGEDKISG